VADYQTKNGSNFVSSIPCGGDLSPEEKVRMDTINSQASLKLSFPPQKQSGSRRNAVSISAQPL
jgi:hypothetical protein